MSKIHQLEMDTFVELKDINGNIKMKKKLPKNVSGIHRENTIDIIVTSKNGVIVREMKNISMKSYVANWLAVYSRLCNIGAYAYQQKSLNNSNVTSTAHDYCNYSIGGGDLSLKPIIVGTGAGSVSYNQYNLTTKIVHGNGAGQLNHSNSPSGDLSVSIDGNYSTFSISRTFTNNSGGDITVTEIGLTTYSAGLAGSLSNTVMCARDIKDKNGNDINMLIANGQTLTVTYNFYFGFLDGALIGMGQQFWRACFPSPPTLSVVFTNGSSGNIAPGSTPRYIFSGSGVADWGIMVGSGSTVPTISDYSLVTPITHGTGAGQLSYAASSVIQSQNNVGEYSSFIIGRVFTNNTGGDVTIREMGIAEQGSGSTTRLLTLRKLTGNIVLNNGESVTVQQKYGITTHD